MVNALIAAGADSTATTAFDMSLLHTAAYQGDGATVTALLNNGFDVDAVDINGRSALHYAEADMVPLLVEAGLDVNQPDAAGNTPIFNAMNGGEVERAGALYAAGADASPLLAEKSQHLLRAAQFGQTELGSYLIDNGADVNAGAANGMTALDIAI